MTVRKRNPYPTLLVFLEDFLLDPPYPLEDPLIDPPYPRRSEPDIPQQLSGRCAARLTFIALFHRLGLKLFLVFLYICPIALYLGGSTNCILLLSDLLPDIQVFSTLFSSRLTPAVIRTGSISGWFSRKVCV